MPANELGAFLRARRAAVEPGEVGLPLGARRRVAGLRREELAALAGLNSDYYRRIEQGRETHPSAQVVGSLARALGLRRDERDHLLRLAGVLPVEHPGATTVHPALRSLLAQWPAQPAFVLDEALDVLAANALGDALHRGFTAPDNLALMVFADPGAPVFYRDWQEVAADTAANLRLGRGRVTDTRRIDGIVQRLLASNGVFAELWARNEVQGKTRSSKRLHHPDVGDLVLDFETLHVEGTPSQYLLLYHAETGTASSDALRLLGALTADAPRAG